MSDRIKGLTVTLRDDLRDDDAQPIIEAIKLLKGVVDVVKHVSNADHYMATRLAKVELSAKLWEILK